MKNTAAPASSSKAAVGGIGFVNPEEKEAIQKAAVKPKKKNKQRQGISVRLCDQFSFWLCQNL